MHVTQLHYAIVVYLRVGEPQLLLPAARREQRHAFAQQDGQHRNDVFADQAAFTARAGQFAAAHQPCPPLAARREPCEYYRRILGGYRDFGRHRAETLPREHPAGPAGKGPVAETQTLFIGAAPAQDGVHRAVERGITVVLARAFVAFAPVDAAAAAGDVAIQAGGDVVFFFWLGSS